MMSAAGVEVSTVPSQGAGPGSTPRAALQSTQVRPIPMRIAKAIVVRNHYLHSLPGGSKLAFGVMIDGRLMGVVTLGVGPYNTSTLVDGASSDDCLSLTRLWLSDKLPGNSESRVLGVVLRSLKKHTKVKFLVTYADPVNGHVGTIYQATNWLYTGLSEPTPLYDLGDGTYAHCRTVATKYGSRSVKYLSDQGLPVKLVPQSAKHRYVYFLDLSWLPQLKVPVLPYPEKGDSHATD